MCAPVYSSLFLLHILVIVTIISTNMKMSTDGLPLDRQERGIDDNYNNDDYNDGGILAGEDFLSVFMRSTFKDTSIYQRRPTTTTTESTTVTDYNRETRSLTEQTEANISLYETTISDNSNNNDNSHNNSKSSDNYSDDRTLRQDDEEFFTVATTSEQLPSLLAESNKHNFGVEEIEPITLKSDSTPIEFERDGGYPAKIQPLQPNQFHQHHHQQQQSTSSFITQEFENEKDKIHQTVIFHDNPINPGSRARSVSYSTVIQALPNTHFNKKQQEEQQRQQQRHYDRSQSLININFDKDSVNFENTTNYQETTIATTVPTTITTTSTTTTERNWEHFPVIYNMPEQNYEVDESVSVMTNGRVHGIQTSPPPPTPLSIITQLKDNNNNNKNVNVSNNNNKVGYVVQGRNYRKYRVEERTSDGFIVGEYGVVSNDDGTLRGVRYTADGTISRRLIQDALMKFLSL